MDTFQVPICLCNFGYGLSFERLCGNSVCGVFVCGWWPLLWVLGSWTMAFAYIWWSGTGYVRFLLSIASEFFICVFIIHVKLDEVADFVTNFWCWFVCCVGAVHVVYTVCFPSVCGLVRLGSVFQFDPVCVISGVGVCLEVAAPKSPPLFHHSTVLCCRKWVLFESALAVLSLSSFDGVRFVALGMLIRGDCWFLGVYLEL